MDKHKLTQLYQNIFDTMKELLCRDTVLAGYNRTLVKRIYVDQDPEGKHSGPTVSYAWQV